MDDDTEKIMENNEEHNSTSSGKNLGYNSVKSAAIVKYSAVESPATFSLLECNTDLNLPPANWLSSSAESYGLRNVLSNSTEFSSLRMADMFPDCVGEVDVISDAENVKKLLKLPYSRGPVSMLVHRIKATLLIDDFDIHKFLFKSAEINWHALKNFLRENVFHSVENTRKCITHESKRRYTLQEENLKSKFLYHSIGHLEEKQPKKLKFNKNEQNKCDSSSSTRPPLPEFNLSGELPDSDSEHIFSRNVVWTFNNIQMLLGTDMPIFGGGTHPCVSLRLRDMSKPISVLTGIDYWLDNLMCNVPEVAMCYHIEGIVQKYELIKTEDLPYMEDSEFSPALIRDVAQNILAFLKSNATKAGHTYWLLKGKDDDVVKLYDLTSLCSNNMVDSSQNPFTIPVALLLYRVARNMIHSPRVKLPTNPATIRMLLKNCIRLLPKEKYPQIITSAHYMFSDSLIPLNTDPTSPKLEDISEVILNDGNKRDILYGKEEDDDEVDVEIKTLCLSKKPNSNGEKAKGYVFNGEEPDIMQSLERRCQVAIEHLADGLNCLKYFDDVDSDKEKKPLNMADPRTPIPMPYESINKKSNEDSNVVEKCETKKKKPTKNKENLHKSIGALLCQSHIETMPTWQHPPEVDDISAWKQHLKILLYEKACLVYATLAEYEYSVERYGNALKHIKYVLESRTHLTSGSCENILMSYLLGRAGDCCFQIGRKWELCDKYKKEYSKLETFDEKMKNVMSEEEVQKFKELDFLPSEINTLDNILNCSWMCYSKAIELENRDTEKDNLQRRLGNICNELGSYYMKKARETMPDSEVPRKQVEALFAISMTHLQNGIKAFKNVNDRANLALLYSNTGRLRRLMAHFYSKDNLPLTKVPKKYYENAVKDYQSALAALDNRKSYPEIYDTVYFELSTTYYTMATLLQDYSTQDSYKNKAELEQEVKQYLKRASDHCDVKTPGPKQPIYQFRSADIHHRFASLHHSMLREMDKETSKRNQYAQICHRNYERAVKLFLNLELPAPFLRAQLERVALYEYLSESSSGDCKIKYLQSALDLILQCAPILKMIQDRKEQTDSTHTSNEEKNGQCDTKLILKEKVKSELDDTDVLNNSAFDEKRKNDEIDNDDDEKNDEVLEENKMLELLESRLQFILRNLIRRCSSSSQTQFSSLTEKYKRTYLAVLKCSEDQLDKLSHLYNILENFDVGK